MQQGTHIKLAIINNGCMSYHGHIHQQKKQVLPTTTQVRSPFCLCTFDTTPSLQVLQLNLAGVLLNALVLLIIAVCIGWTIIGWTGGWFVCGWVALLKFLWELSYVGSGTCIVIEIVSKIFDLKRNKWISFFHTLKFIKLIH